MFHAALDPPWFFTSKYILNIIYHCYRSSDEHNYLTNTLDKRQKSPLETLNCTCWEFGHLSSISTELSGNLATYRQFKLNLRGIWPLIVNFNWTYGEFGHLSSISTELTGNLATCRQFKLNLRGIWQLVVTQEANLPDKRGPVPGLRLQRPRRSPGRL